MKLKVRKVRAAAVAANLAAQAAVAARELLAEDPSAWEVPKQSAATDTGSALPMA